MAEQIGTIYVELSLEAKKYLAGLKIAEAEATKIANKIDAEFKKQADAATKSTTSMISGLLQMFSNVKLGAAATIGILTGVGAVAAYAALTVGKIAASIMFAGEAAREARIDRQFEAATEAIGSTAKEFSSSLDRIFGGTMEETKMKQQAMIMLSRGMSEETIKNAARAAEGLARITGASIEQEFKAMSQSIMAGYPRALVTLGLITRNEMQAITAGFRMGTLSQLELSEIIVQKVDAQMGRLGGATDDAQQKILRFYATYDNFKSKLKEPFSEAGVEWFVRMTKLIDDYGSSIKSVVDYIMKMPNIWEVPAKLADKAAEIWAAATKKIGDAMRAAGLQSRAEYPGSKPSGPTGLETAEVESANRAARDRQAAEALANYNKGITKQKEMQYSIALNIARAENEVKKAQQDQTVVMAGLALEKAKYLADSSKYISTLATEFTMNRDLAELEKTRIDKETRGQVDILKLTIAAAEVKESEAKRAIELGNMRLTQEKALLDVKIAQTDPGKARDQMVLQAKSLDTQIQEMRTRATMSDQQRAALQAQKEELAYRIKTVEEAGRLKKEAVDQNARAKENELINREIMRTVELQGQLMDSQRAVQLEINSAIQERAFLTEEARLELESTIVDYDVLMGRATELDKLEVTAAQKRLQFEKQIATEVDKIAKAQAAAGEEWTANLEKQVEDSAKAIENIHVQRETYEAVLVVLKLITAEQIRQQAIQGRSQFWGQLMAISGGAGEGAVQYMKALTEQLDEQVKLWRSWNIPEDAIQKMVQFQTLQNRVTSGATNWADSIEAGAKKWSASIDNMSVQLANLTDNVLQNFTTGAADAFMTWVEGSKNAGDAFREFARDFVKQVAQMIMRMTIALILQKALGWAYGGVGGVPAGSYGGPEGAYGIMHGGGIVGRDRVPIRQMPEAMFLNAPRLHNGLMADEFPAILRKGEKVVPKSKATEPAGPTNNLNLSVRVDATNAKFASELRRELEEYSVKAVERKIKEYS